MMMGTSTVHFLLSGREAVVPGIAGVARDAISPGQFLYGVPQVAVGDAFNWFTEQVNESHEYLTEKAEKLSPGANGLVALDWWNGGRKPEVVGDLSGAVIGYTLQTTMTASAAMVPAPILKVKPVVKNKHFYAALYTQYLGLIKIFGHNESPLLKLREINRKSFRQ